MVYHQFSKGDEFLCFVPNDWDGVFDVSEKLDGNITYIDFIFDWMLDRGVFYRFSDGDAADSAASLFCALGIPAMFIPVGIHDPADVSFFKSFSFEEFAPIVLSSWFSKRLSYMFNSEEVITPSDFKSLLRKDLYRGDFRARSVYCFQKFSDFEQEFESFLFNFKNIKCCQFLKRSYNHG